MIPPIGRKIVAMVGDGVLHLFGFFPFCQSNRLNYPSTCIVLTHKTYNDYFWSDSSPPDSCSVAYVCRSSFIQLCNNKDYKQKTSKTQGDLLLWRVIFYCGGCCIPLFALSLCICSWVSFLVSGALIFIDFYMFGTDCVMFELFLLFWNFCISSFVFYDGYCLEKISPKPITN